MGDRQHIEAALANVKVPRENRQDIVHAAPAVLTTVNQLERTKV